MVTALVIALLLLSVGGLFLIQLDHSIEVMLPSGSDTQQTIRFLRDIDFSAKVVLSFSQADASLERAEFFHIVDEFALAMDSPLITQAVSSFDDRQMMNDLGFFLRRAPELFGEEELKELDGKITPAGVERALKKKYIQLLKPEGSFMGGMISRDPLDIQMAMIEKIRALSTSFGYAMRIEDNHIVSNDGKQVLMILETTIPFTDSKGSRELVEFIGGRLKELPPSVSATMVCGHLHTISNEKTIKRDIRLTVSIAGGAFILLFLLFFKDARANLIFFLPFAALLIAVNLSALMLGKLSMMMLGFGSVIAGIAVDYGIHVYIAVRRGDHPAETVQAVTRPVLLGALTTAGVFVAFLFSSIPGYRQLACFALLSILIAVGGALLILPLYIAPKSIVGTFPKLGKWPRRRALVAIGVFILLLPVGLPLAMRVRFDSDISRLDGTDQVILDQEKQFQETWGGGESGQAIAAIAHSDYEQALELNDRIYDEAVKRVGAENVSSLSRIWKSSSHRKENSNRWKKFWSAGRGELLKKLIAEKGAPFGFAPDAFDPFFQALPAQSTAEGETPDLEETEPEDNMIFSQIKGRFIQQKKGITQALTFFPDQKEFVEEMAGLKQEIPGLMLVSRNAISLTLARDYTREFIRISLIALVLVLAVSGLLLRNLRMMLIVLVPAFAGVLSVLVLVGAVGSALNVMNLISGIIVIGLCIDYGVFYVHSYVHSLNLGTRTAITLSAGTTLIGAGALLFAKHPALFSVGLTLVGGISAGYITSMLVVPALCSLFLKERS